jgi:hypothetical protein
MLNSSNDPRKNGEVALESLVTIREGVVFRELEGEAVLLSLESGTYFGLNEVGTRIWALIQEHRSLRSVLETMQQEYEVSPKTLESDLLRLVEELQAKGLVSISQAPAQKEEASSRGSGAV